MYLHLFKIILSRRYELRVRFFKKILDKVGLVSVKMNYIAIIEILIRYFTDIILTFGVCLLTSSWNKNLVLSIIIIYFAISTFVQGASEYRTTFLFPFDSLKPISLASDKEIFLSLVCSSIAYKFILNGSLGSIITFSFFMFGISVKSIIICINIVVISLGCFLVGNVLLGKYMYNIIVRRVGILRVLVYFFWILAIYMICNNFINPTIKYMKNIFCYNIKSLYNLFDDKFVEELFNNIGKEVINFFKAVGIGISNIADYLNIYCLFFILIILFIVFILDVKMIPRNIENTLSAKNDLYNLYYKYLYKSYKMVFRSDLLLDYQIKKVIQYRWAIIKYFFQITIINYEAIIYMCIFNILIGLTGDTIIRVELIMIMEIMTLANQSFDMRISGNIFYSFSVEREMIQLLKMSKKNKKEMYRAKEKSFYLMFIIPTLIIAIYTAILCFLYKIDIYYSVLFFSIIFGCFYIMPKIQMYMIPLVSNFKYIDEYQVGESFEESEIANKMQEFPRLFLVIIPLIMMFFLIFIKKIRSWIFFLVQIVYLFSIGFILVKYMMNKIIDKGIDRVYDEIN